MLQFSFSFKSAGCFFCQLVPLTWNKLHCFWRERETLSMMSSAILKAFCISYFQHDVEIGKIFLCVSDKEGWKIAKYIGKTFVYFTVKKRSFYFNALQHNGCMMHFLEGFLSVSHKLLCQLMNVFFSLFCWVNTAEFVRGKILLFDKCYYCIER